MDVTILRFWFALKANFTDVRPLTLKMRQERFLTKGSFFYFARSLTNELRGLRERRRRERRKIGDFAVNIALREISPKMPS